MDKVGDLSVTQWNYKGKSGDHIGPIAQDFYQAFGLGTSDKSITTVDADGISLAAIKGLLEKTERLLDRIEQLESENAYLKEENDDMRADIGSGEDQMRTVLDRLSQLERLIDKNKETLNVSDDE